MVVFGFTNIDSPDSTAREVLGYYKRNRYFQRFIETKVFLI
jgi:hypothetical protein